ncbi:heat-shock protein Hsp20 [Natronococcus pandeyae]|uniref:Heat-shock protein Hsp20 n=1 Tax=Natronococcus pandeyae TaxID=2055836 RepID=A0A8J8Q6N9_9EURY|nr:Hsp20/alpha crystallin family protein [Natronococcus pandeyae]TYL38250.1 heat-shock protein Hsp20 [Natronococcus pandeyae]
MRSFDEMNRMFREMDRMFDQFRSSWMDEFAAQGYRPARPMLEGGVDVKALEAEPTANLEDEGDAYVFVVDLPGFEKEDIDLSFRNGTLSVRAHTDAEDGSDAYRSMRSRRVAKQVPVPKEIVTDEITASYHNGVLEVRLPILEDERDEDGHRIDIE